MPTSPAVLNRGLTQRALPSPNADSSANDVAVRYDRYGGAFGSAPVVGHYPEAEEGTLFIARTPTPGTGVSYATSITAFSDTSPLLFLNATSSTKSIWLHHLKLIITAAQTLTTFQIAVKTDTAFRTIVTNNMTTVVPKCPNLGISATSTTVVTYQNASTATALAASSGSAIVVSEHSMGGLDIVGDEYLIEFGQRQLSGGSGLTAAQAVCSARKASSGPPVVVPPLGSATFHLWGAGLGAALSYSFELAFREVP